MAFNCSIFGAWKQRLRSQKGRVWKAATRFVEGLVSVDRNFVVVFGQHVVGTRDGQNAGMNWSCGNRVPGSPARQLLVSVCQGTAVPFLCAGTARGERPVRGQNCRCSRGILRSRSVALLSARCRRRNGYDTSKPAAWPCHSHPGSEGPPMQK